MSETTKGEAPDILLLGLAEWLRVNHPVAAARYTPAIHAALRAIATPPTPDLDAVPLAVDEVIRAAQSLGMSLGEGLSETIIAQDRDILHDRRTALLAAVRPQVPADLDAVVARVREYLETYSWAADTRTVDRLGNGDDVLFVGDLRALLAAVSRPAEARGEPVAWVPRERESGHLWMQYVSRTEQETREFVERESLVRQHLPKPCDAIPLYTHPAPSGGEGEDVDLAQLAWLLERHDGHHTHIGITQPVAHAAARAIRRLLAAPRPEPGEPSEAMVEAAAKVLIIGVNGLTEKGWRNEGNDRLLNDIKNEAMDAARRALTAALAAQRGNP